MPEQFSLPGFETALHATDRLFFAIIPTADAAAAIVRQTGLLCDEYALKGKSIARGRLHVTLNFLGDYLGLPQDIVAAAKTAAASVRAAPFDVVFDRTGSFRGRRRNYPLVLLGDDGVAALSAFQQTLGVALQRNGLRSARSHYTPHLTLLYNNYQLPLRAIAPIRWTVNEFVLVRSLLGETRHIQLARWPLLS
ncbi:RNA 2',3'-cyclic phosphodiesterase [Collimonas sp.]|jgi:2'-5' RNA ligase|uniref:RNA 2',3'-cyclic phosphodiesterase n=1 Tax=Collimonas sp. TaxID=1963772 RepID=UPI002CA82E21|nr:RNA 2',3'-cyclic phosphodiesterase [Collimonas sp.]HWW03858.1 RNA 2',3'-cyclic phosphodiesterase [Collimonas sp.]